MNHHHDTKARSFRFRVLFQKTGESRLLSHLDIVKIMRAAFLEAEIPVTVSGNSAPQPQIAFGPALPMNVESRAEFLDFFAWKYMSPEEFVPKVNRVLSPDLAFHEATQISKNADSLSSLIDGADYSADVSPLSESSDFHRGAVERFCSRDEVLLTRHKTDKIVNLKKFVRSIQYDEASNRVCIEMSIIEGATVGVHAVIQAIYGGEPELAVVRDRLYIWIDGEKRSPLTLEWEQMQVRKLFLDMTT